MRRLRLMLAGALTAALLTGGCGIPDNSTVVPVHNGPARDQSSGGDVPLAKPSRADTSDRATFLGNYLAAAAGDNDSATNAVKSYMAPDLARSFKPVTNDIKVIRLIGDALINPNDPWLSFEAQLVGTLNGQGILTPAQTPDTTKYEIAVGNIPGQDGLFVTNIKQNALLLSDTALAAYYTRRPIYFWNTDHSRLIPDIRYMPLSVPEEQRPTNIVAWLVGGPADWLKQVAEPLPPDTRQIGNVPAVSNNTMQVSLNSQALPDDATPQERQQALDWLEVQLRWSLQPDLTGVLELNIEHQPVQTYKGNGYLPYNGAYKPTPQLQRFVVYEGQVRRLSRSYGSSDPVPALTAATNKNVRVVSYGQSDSRTYVALVTDQNGKQALQVGSADIGDPAGLRPINLTKPIGRPVWAVSPTVGKADGTIGLVPAGGRLFSFASDGTGISQVLWPGGPGAITSVAVAPDARRVALVAGGRLFLATMSNDDGVQLSAPVPIQTELVHLTAVDWTSESMLVVAGARTDSGRSSIMDMSIDGAVQTDRLKDLGSSPVSYLVASPASPTGNENTSAPVAYVLGSAAYDDIRPDLIDVKDLAVAVANPRADASPPSAPAFLG